MTPNNFEEAVRVVVDQAVREIISLIQNSSLIDVGSAFQITRADVANRPSQVVERIEKAPVSTRKKRGPSGPKKAGKIPSKELASRILEFLSTSEGRKSLGDIAAQFNAKPTQVSPLLKRLRDDHLITMYGTRRTATYSANAQRHERSQTHDNSEYRVTTNRYARSAS